MVVDTSAQERLQRDLERLERFRVLDDTFMRQVFKDNLPLAQQVLRIITGIGDLELVCEETQRDLKRLAGSRSVALDVFGKGADGEQYDLEVQTGSDLEPLRFRYYGSAMDVDRLKAGSDYSKLPERWVVVVLEEDPDGAERAARHYSTKDEDGSELGDGTHLLYANASYRGDNEFGRLMADFCERDPDAIRNPLMRERVQYLKRDPKGVAQMCKISEEIYNEGVKQGMEQGIVRSVRSLAEKTGVGVAEALGLLDVPESERPKYLELLRA